MRATEMKALSTPELETRLEDSREELFKLRFQFSTGQLTDYTRLKVVRRDIARAATLLRERELAAQLAGEGEQS